MKLDEIVAWYQKKIGTYDKQQWEKTVEQKILDGFTSVTLKTAKLKPELIDVDLVRGSTFPKAKSKQTLLTVIRLAILRYFFLPIYAQWWVTQTSPNVFAILLFLYITQMINWAMYTFNVHRLEHNNGNITATASYAVTNFTQTIDEPINGEVGQPEEHLVTLSELWIPMALSLLLSLIHSQIVATNIASGAKVKHRRFSNTSQSGKLPRESRVRRRKKKVVRVRNQDGTDIGGVQLRKPITIKKLQSSVEVVKNCISNKSALEASTSEVTCHNSSTFPSAATSSSSCCNQEIFKSTASIIRSSYQTVSNPAILKLDLKHNQMDCSSTDCLDDNPNSFNHKKRNVNWHSPIHNYAIETQEKQQQTSPQSATTTTTNTSATNSPNKTSSCTSISPICPTTSEIVIVDDCVQEFYNDLINRTDLSISSNGEPSQQNSNSAAAVVRNAIATRRNIGEDDGFESLNGKSSSGEETNSPLPTTSTGVAKNNLRLRLNATDFQIYNQLEDLSLKEVETKPATLTYRRKVPLSSESDYEKQRPPSVCATSSTCDVYQTAKKIHALTTDASTETEDEGDVGDGEVMSSPTLTNTSNYNECTTSATEWLGVTTNSEECSYSSEFENSDSYLKNHPMMMTDDDGNDMDFTPTTILNAHGTTDRISCTIWDQREIKKAQMSVLEISSCIIERVESMPETHDYIYIGICFSFLLSLIPTFCRLCEVTIDSDKPSEINYFDMPMLLWEKASFSFFTIFRFAFGNTQWERTVLIVAVLQRLCLTLILFIIFAVAERTFKQRFLYAKLFSHLTSSRRARKSNLPHFRLNKVRNIKTWLSVRSYLKKRGPQRSVDVIVSAAFMVTLLLLSFLSVEWLKDSVHLHSHLNLEALMWSTTIGIFLLRFMTLGNKIHTKYRSVSVLITEQINLYLQIEQKPKKKDELMVSNSVLKLAADLLKELESPFKISGLSANPYLFTTIKVVILSALSGVLSEMLGFKLKLHKIKIK